MAYCNPRTLAIAGLALLLAACDAGDKRNNDGGGGDGLPGFGAAKTRYQMANACWALQARDSGLFLRRDGAGFVADAASIGEAEPLYFKPSALGRYLLLDSEGQLLAAQDGALGRVARGAASPAAEFDLRVVGDSFDYPQTPQYNVEPTVEQVAAWDYANDPLRRSRDFTLSAADAVLGQDEAGLVNAAGSRDAAASAFRIEPTTGCATFPEASSDFSGTPFAGKRADGSVLGHADVHVHISATEFLGGAQWGRPYHPYGVEQALGNCTVEHGDFGQFDAVGGLLGGDFDGHATDGWPTFSDWPARNMLTHEAIYWKWLERSWAAGLRVVVNDLVDNETLCELQRNLTRSPATDCDPMNNAGRQAGTMYGMENYIDAQYGGPGQGFFQVVRSAQEAREVIEEGKMAVILGIEISNLFNCQLTYSPLRTQAPHEEDGSGGLENRYSCTTEEGLPNSIDTQMQRAWNWGVRQLITIHEFDNAFGGNGIFDMAVLNLGNRENSGGIPGEELGNLAGLLTGDVPPDQAASVLAALPQTETPTGEFWNTYDCPVEGETEGFSGYLWGSSGGAAAATSPLMLSCPPLSLSGTGGGPLYCYPAGVNQCNARWMTPAGVYTYGKLMEYGFMFDFDHMEMGMKTQALEYTEAQTPQYPIVSTHGTFGGTTLDQARRVLAGGGVLYPSNGSSRGFVRDMEETLGLHEEAMATLPPEERLLFGFGYGTDTNGLSGQTGPRGDIEAGKEIVYPYEFYSGAVWDALPDFAQIDPVRFEQPVSRDIDGNVARAWHQDIDGNAHHGMLSGFVQEIVLEAGPEAVEHLFNSAEVYLRTWERTELAAAAIQAEGLKQPAQPLLRPAPPEGPIAP